MKLTQGTVAAITGAGSGIGRALALHLAGRGCALALADVQGESLEETARQARAAATDAGAAAVTTHVCDVSDFAAVESYAAQAVAAHGGVQLLINNAGVALGGSFQDISIADFHWLMGVNFWGVVNGCKAFLPTLLRQPEAHIVNLSSVFGLLAPPGQTAYVASKYAIRGFTESLRLELHTTAIHVSAVHPGGVATNIARNARLGSYVPPASDEQVAAGRAAVERSLTLPPARAATIIVAGIERNRRRIFVGRDAQRIAVLTRCLPLSMVEAGMLRQLGAETTFIRADRTDQANPSDAPADARR